MIMTRMTEIPEKCNLELCDIPDSCEMQVKAYQIPERHNIMAQIGRIRLPRNAMTWI